MTYVDRVKILYNAFICILDESTFANLFREQISDLTVSIRFTELHPSLDDLSNNIYLRLFSIFTKLTDLDFRTTGCWRRHARLALYNSPIMSCVLPNIINLHISVATLDDCLCLLDGRLASLQRLFIIIYDIEASVLDIGSMVQKFSLEKFFFYWNIFFQGTY